MNKARKKTYKKGIFKRLVNESFILSSTRFVSSRVVRFFETGFVSPILNSFKTVDGFVSEKLTKPLFEKVQLRKKFAMPARNTVASAVARNPVMQKLALFRSSFLNSSLRSVGLFMLVFSIYTAAIFLLKRYISSSLGAPAVNDICTAAVMLVAGLLLVAFGDKSIISSVGNSRFASLLFSECLGVNDSSFLRNNTKPPKFSMVIAFLSGLILGTLTLFFSPLRILFGIGGFFVSILILNIPEFGLLSAVAMCSFVHIKYVSFVTVLTVISYFLKCVRLKRNFRFGTADAVMLFVLFAMAISMSSNGYSDGERYFICSVLLYFVAKNVIVSEKLLNQAFNSLSLCLFMGVSLDLLGEYAHRIPFADISAFALKISAYALDGEMMAMLAVVILPFVFFSFSAFGSKRGKLVMLLLALASAVIYDSFLYYTLIAVSFFVYIAASKKAPTEAILGAVVAMPPVLLILADYSKSAVVTAGSASFLDASFGFADGVPYANFWSAFSRLSGVFGAILLAASLILIFQRILGCAVKSSSARTVCICGTVTASVIMILVCGFMFNPFADLRVVSALWFVFGLCGAVTTVSVNKSKEV